MRPIRLALLSATAFLVLFFASNAQAADRIYWANFNNDTISYANTDGSGGGQLDITGATAPTAPGGVALDPAHGRIYWISNSGVSFANLDGSGGGADLDVTGADLSSPRGLDIDVAGGKLYWANEGANSISYARLDGSGGGVLDVTGSATPLNAPMGVAVSPATNRIFWASRVSGKIQYANLDNTGGSADLDTTGATFTEPVDVAVDAAGGKVYWTGSNLGYANLDGSGGGGELSTSGAVSNFLFGLAIDSPAGNLFYINHGDNTTPAGVAKLDNSGAADLATTGATASDPNYPALLKRPVPQSAPAVSGGTTVGSTLSCGGGQWSPAAAGAHVAQAPTTTGFQWTRDGAPIAGADAGTLVANVPGRYSCAIVGSNAAGTATSASPEHQVTSTSLKFGKVVVNKKKGTATLTVTLPSAGRLKVSGTGVSAKLSRKPSTSTRIKVTIKAKGKSRSKLVRKGAVKLKVKFAFTPAGSADTFTTKKTIKLRKNR